MAEDQNMSMDQIEFMKRMKAIASDLWGGRYTEEETAEKPEPIRLCAQFSDLLRRSFWHKPSKAVSS